MGRTLEELRAVMGRHQQRGCHGDTTHLSNVLCQAINMPEMMQPCAACKHSM
jgi:hypothetical protein